MQRQRLEREVLRRQRHSADTNRAASSTLYALLPKVRASVNEATDSQDVLAQLAATSDGNTKRQLCSQVATLALARCAAHIYSCSLVTLIVRCQFARLGGLLLSSERGSGKSVTKEEQEDFLGLTRAFIEAKSYPMQSLVRFASDLASDVTKDVAENKSSDEVTEEVMQIIEAMTKEETLSPTYLLTSLAKSFSSSSSLMAGCLDVLESEDAQRVLKSSLRQGEKSMTQLLAPYSESHRPLARWLAPLAGVFSSELDANGLAECPMLAHLVAGDDIGHTLALNAYEAFCQREDQVENNSEGRQGVLGLLKRVILLT